MSKPKIAIIFRSTYGTKHQAARAGKAAVAHQAKRLVEVTAKLA